MRPLPASSSTPPLRVDRRVLRRLYAYLLPHRRRFFWASFLTVALSLLGLAIPYLIGRAVQAVQENNTLLLYEVLAGLLAAAGATYAASFGQTHFVGATGEKIITELRIDLFTRLQQLSLDYYERERAGWIISRLTNDIEVLRELLRSGVTSLVASLLTLVGTIAVMAALEPLLALATLSIFPILALATVLFRSRSRTAYRALRVKVAQVNAQLQETLSGMRTVQTFGAEEHLIKDFAGVNESYRKANMRTVMVAGLYFPGVELLSAAGTAVVLGFGGYLVLQGKTELWVLVAFLGYLVTFFSPIEQLSQLYNTLQDAAAALERVFSVFDEKPSVTQEVRGLALPPLQGEITFSGVHFSYPAAPHQKVLENFNLTIHPGETVALVGPTGGGKSTIVKLVLRFYDPTRGAVLVDGHDLRRVSSTSYRRQVAIVPQEVFLFAGTVWENLTFARPTATPNEVQEAAQAVGAHGFIEQLPQGYHTPIGERGSHLSQGQRQLIALARALVVGPALLVLDEATSHVDIPTERRIQKALGNVLGGRTALIIAHRLSTIQRADRILFIHKGRIVEEGTHAQLLERRGPYAALYTISHKRSA